MHLLKILTLLLIGLCSPIFAEIVPEKSRTSVYALDRSFESILSSFAPPIVGILAQQVYGYKQLPQGSDTSQDIKTDRENASSLAKALYTAIGVPMTLCCFIYSFLYCTYPRDRERARMEALIESEMQQLHLEDASPSWSLSGPEEILVEDTSIIGVEDEGEEELQEHDLEDGDERALLYRQLTFANLGK